MTGRGWARGSIRSTVVALAGLALIEGAGCQSNDASTDDELLALLHDDSLTILLPEALADSVNLPDVLGLLEIAGEGDAERLRHGLSPPQPAAGGQWRFPSQVH